MTRTFVALQMKLSLVGHKIYIQKRNICMVVKYIQTLMITLVGIKRWKEAGGGGLRPHVMVSGCCFFFGCVSPIDQ